ncbi:MAG TPA: class III extradiol ring-cleavage dioxygenase [Anaeromyxobacteraceae bacterium]|nr:class III extradiol ring-cleavage dioxygenase [Anaeromyxobacteraceae bacterium]
MARAPVIFVSHGAPTEALEVDGWTQAVARLGRRVGRPRAIAVVSAHWVTPGAVAVTSSPAPETIHDFYGFPAPLYRIQYPAPGDPALAARIVALLEGAGIDAAADPARGLDHGAWTPLLHAWPLAEVPVVQVSLPVALPADLLRFGAALAPLRDDGIVLLASGGAVHNLGEVAFDDKERGPRGWAADFDGWVAARLAALDVAALARWKAEAPHAARAHPTTEHFDPLLVAVGARAPGDAVEVVHEGFTYGTLGMRSFALRS